MVRKEASHQIILGVTNETHGIATGLIAGETDGMSLSTKGFRRFDGQKKPATRDDKSHLKCEECGMNRHTKGQCFKIIGESIKLTVVGWVGMGGAATLPNGSKQVVAISCRCHRRVSPKKPPDAMDNDQVKENQEKDKNRIKTGQNGKRVEAEKSLKQLQWGHKALKKPLRAVLFLVFEIVDSGGIKLPRVVPPIEAAL
nr:hypothetical protein [Tanacetum cinerariifolium]